MMNGKNITWKYAHKKGAPTILHDVSFKLAPGLVTAFIGPSGAGKTSLLKCMANLLTGYEGSITINGRELKDLSAVERASTVGFVLQQFHLFPHMTVLENCMYALKQVLLMKAELAEARCLEVLDKLGMSKFVHAYPAKLSGGQQQRVAIARAMVLEPQILLFDEPTSALDPTSKQSLVELIQDFASKGMTIGISSHDMPFVRKIYNHIYFLEEGKVVEVLEQPNANTPKIDHFLLHAE